LKGPSSIATFCGLLSLVSVAGCSLFPTTRKLPVPKPPAVVQTAASDELVAQMNQRWDAIQSFTATVDIQATESKTKEGVEKVFPSCRGYIVMQKPKKLRVLGKDFGVTVFDMASDGDQFKLVIPQRNLAFEGSTTAKGTSPNPMYNLRPDFFFDALLVHGVSPEDFYSRIADTETIEDAAKKHLYTMPEYVLSITRHNPGSRNDTPVRVITIHRDDLLPYQQDLYDDHGTLETQVFYSQYADFGGNKYPSVVTIKRPLEGIQLVLTVETVHQNPKLVDNQFEIQMPQDVKVQKLE
jgi:outer membrane lipoprotein-sorting protein